MSGFSTLNRWLGKKNKDKTPSATANGKFSKSSTNLSISTTNLNEPSQLEYNRITPLPVVTSNAPFEQTFRITVLLPKDQLYVCRLGARVPLSKLLELVCENKLLDPEKYEFRNPVDPSQVYNCELTIGAVGLSEIRLCHKSESYDYYNPDEVIKLNLNRTNIIRDSLSSSEYSSRLTKSQTTKTPSPYSSSNSLNSMDSTGMNSTRTPMIKTATAAQVSKTNTSPTKPLSNNATVVPNGKIAPPPRKKRAAPRPPSQSAIPEKGPVEMSNGDVEKTLEDLKNANHLSLPKKDYYVSTPNLTGAADITNETDCNGNLEGIGESPSNGYHLPGEESGEEKNNRNLYRGSVQDLSSNHKDQAPKIPEPSPRKRLIQIKKKTTAPAPPPRNSLFKDTDDEDAMSIASTSPSLNSGLSVATPATTPATSPCVEVKPIVSQTNTQGNEQEKILEKNEILEEKLEKVSPTPLKRETSKENKMLEISKEQIPKPVPRQISTTNLLNIIPLETQVESPAEAPKPQSNISKVLLNRTPTPEPRSLSTEPPELDLEEEDNVSKQADSGIGEPIPSPLPDSLPSEGSTHECKSAFESSSDDDEMIKVYNFKLGKTLKPLGEHKTLEDLTVLQNGTASGHTTPTIVNQENSTPSSLSVASWNFAIPISPPPNFADGQKASDGQEMTKISNSNDIPIQPKIVERPVLNFDAISSNSLERKPKALQQKREPVTPAPSPCTPLNEIVDELSTIIQENRMDSLIRQAKDHNQIEAAKPNTLANFSISTISQQPQQQYQTCHISQNESHSQSVVEEVKSSRDVKEEKAVKVIQEFIQTEISIQESSKETKVKESEESFSLASVNESSQILRKRSSITNLTSLQQERKNVTRADSFQQPTSFSKQSSLDSSSNGLNSRSSSHMCLTKIEQNGLQTNGKRSSSELSIGESPSLQSLEIIKTILNSRKNSNASNEVIIAKEKDEAILRSSSQLDKSLENERGGEQVDSQGSVVTPDSSLNSSDTLEGSPKPKEIPKTYRYSGPPSINFSTWNERPKVQVEIKNEGDYIFGGKQQSNGKNSVASMARNYRMSMPLESLSSKSSEANQDSVSKNIINPDSPIVRMGIPEKDFKVPITVKPLKDVICENSESSTIVKPQLSQKPVNYGSATLPRSPSGANRLSTQQPLSASPIPGPNLLRSTSINKTDRSLDKSFSKDENETNNCAVPFGQGTLRRTGLKEKILAKEQQATEQTDSITSSSTFKNETSNGVILRQSTNANSGSTKNTTSFISSKNFAVHQKGFNQNLRFSVANPVNTSNSSNTSTQVSNRIYFNSNGSSPVSPSNNKAFAPNTSSVEDKNQATRIVNRSDETIRSPTANSNAGPSSNTNGFAVKSVSVNSSTSTHPKLDLIIPKPKVFNNVTVTNNIQGPKTAPVAPPAPPPSFNLKPVRVVPKSAGATPTNEDPRDALLAAIRNFKKNELNRV